MKNKRIITGIAISLYILVLIAGYFLTKKSMENIYYFSQIIASIIVVSSLIVSVLQYVDTSISNADLRKREKKVKAAEMANNFQKDLLPLMNVLSKAYSDANLKDEVLGKIEQADLQMFNREEVDKMFSEKDVSLIFAKLESAYLARLYTPKKKMLTNKRVR